MFRIFYVFFWKLTDYKHCIISKSAIANKWFGSIIYGWTGSVYGRQARLEHALPDDGCFCNLSACRIWQASACLHPAALKSCEKHLSVRCEQFNIRDFCRYKENTAENTCRIFKVFDAITAKISMLNQYGFGSRLPNSEGMCVFFILRRRVQRYCTAVRGGKNKKHMHSRDNIACASKI